MAGAVFIAKDILKTKREELGSQEEMVSLINAATGKDYGRTFYGNIETGVRPTTAEMALVIARILKMDVSDLFTNKEESKNE